jgi:hypothetical protein
MSRQTIDISVPGAVRVRRTELPDLTTTGSTASGHTVEEDWAGLHTAATARDNPRDVPGVQVDGCFAAPSALNPFHGWNHDAQFVIRLPRVWNGKLVVAGAPGVRRQYALDVLLSDWLLARGYAYAATDKGNSGEHFYTAATRPGGALLEWHHRLTELTVAVRRVVTEYYGTAPTRTYAAGLSNGGYLVRWQLEHRPDLYDGGVDCAGVLWRAAGPNLFRYLPTTLTHYPAYAESGDPAHREAIVAAGIPAGSEFLWELYHRHYWDVTQRIFRAAFDPEYGRLERGTPHAPAGEPFASADAPGSDAAYDYDTRPEAVHDAVRLVELTGRIGKPLVSVHGTLDCLIPASLHADPYAELVEKAGRGRLHRLHHIERGGHVDGFCDLFPGRIEPMAPALRDAFVELEDWVEHHGSR